MIRSALFTLPIPRADIFRPFASRGGMEAYLALWQVDVQHPGGRIAKGSEGIRPPAEGDRQRRAVQLEDLDQISHRPGLAVVSHVSVATAPIHFGSRRAFLRAEQIDRDKSGRAALLQFGV